MPRQESAASKTSLYRLNLPASTQITAAIQDKYLESTFETLSVEIANKTALLVYGEIPNEVPDWTKHVQSLTGFLPPVSNNTSAGTLVIRLEDHHERCYALTWGMGHLLLEPEYFDNGFGLRFALRRADPDEVRALTSHALDTLPKTARMSVFGGAALSAFGLEEIGEVVSRLVGKVSAKGLSCDRTGRHEKLVTIRGSDSLSIPLAKRDMNLLSDLQLIDNVVETEKPAAGLEHLENTHPLRPGNPKIKLLDEELNGALKPGTQRMALCWPAEWDEDTGEANSFRIKGLGRRSKERLDEIELHDLLIPLADVDQEKRLNKLKSLKIQGFTEGGSALTREIAGDRWITFETTLGSDRFVFHRGRWYNIGGAYLEMLRGRIGRILAKKTTESLPPWPKMVKKRKGTGELYTDHVIEGVYNDKVVAAEEGYYSLDRKLVRTDQHPKGFEACDILTPSNALVHVKRLDDSVSASHLFNQAIVSSEALRRQVDALEKFREKVAEISKGERRLPADFRVSRVILAFAGGAANNDSLFTFSQVTLSRCAQRLEELEISLEIAEIPYSEEVIST